MTTRELVLKFKRLELNPLFIGETDLTDDIVLDLLNQAFIKLYSDLLLKIDILECNLSKDEDEYVFPCNFSGEIIDIVDNWDRTNYFIDNHNSWIPISRFNYNQLLIPYPDKIHERLSMDNKTPIVLYFAYKALHDPIKSIDDCDCIPNILELPLRLYMKYKVYDVHSRTAGADIDRYLTMYDRTIYDLKEKGIEIQYKPRGGNYTIDNERIFRNDYEEQKTII
jgi:hypothetical protein